MKCIGCRSSFVNLDETWSKKGSIMGASIYKGFSEEGYCLLNNNSRNAYSWTSAGQVSPKHQLWNKIILKDVSSKYKENFSYVTGDYATMV